METWSLTREFKGRRLVDAVDLKVPYGQVFGIWGAAGAGKSTLLKMLLGILPPSSGGGLCLGLDITGDSLTIREKVGFVPHPSSLYGFMRVYQLIDFYRSFYRQWDLSLTRRLLRLFDIPWKGKVGKLTPHQKKQLSLLLALSPGPELLIVDEPFETSSKERGDNLLFSAVIHEYKTAGHTVLLASRCREELAALADRVLTMEEGKLLDPRVIMKGNLRLISSSPRRRSGEKDGSSGSI